MTAFLFWESALVGIAFGLGSARYLPFWTPKHWQWWCAMGAVISGNVLLLDLMGAYGP